MYTYKCMCFYVCTYICIYMCMYVCIYIYIHVCICKKPQVTFVLSKISHTHTLTHTQYTLFNSRLKDYQRRESFVYTHRDTHAYTHRLYIYFQNPPSPRPPSGWLNDLPRLKSVIVFLATLIWPHPVAAPQQHLLPWLRVRDCCRHFQFSLHKNIHTYIYIVLVIYRMLHICIYIHIHIFAFIYIYIYVYVHIHIYIHMYIYMLYICIYI